MAFTDTKHCKGQLHCVQCRDQAGGRVWRAEMVKAFGGDGVDFDCPQGKQWGSKDAARMQSPDVPKADPAIVDKRLEACVKCEHLNKINVVTVNCKLCGCAGLRPSGGAQQCRAGKW